MFSFNLASLNKTKEAIWNSSFFQLVWLQFVLYYIIYAGVTVLYHYGLSDKQQVNFNGLATYLAKYIANLPTSLIIGYFTAASLNQWSTIAKSIPGTVKPVVIFTFSLKKNLPACKQFIDTYGRYTLLVWILTMRCSCPKLANLFPDLASLESRNFLTRRERIKLEKYLESYSEESLHLEVYDWMNLIIRQVDELGYFRAPTEFNRNIDNAHSFKKSCGAVRKSASSNTLLALNKIVTFVNYTYGIMTILSHQLKEDLLVTSVVSGYIPVPALAYFIYFAWLKVGVLAIDPLSSIDIIKLFNENVQNVTRECRMYDCPLPTNEVLETNNNQQ